MQRFIYEHELDHGKLIEGSCALLEMVKGEKQTSYIMSEIDGVCEGTNFPNRAEAVLN